MTTLNDAIRVATGGGTVNDGLLSFFKAGGASANASYGDAERQWLLSQLGLPVTTPDTNNDLWMKFLPAGPGTINDKMLAYWLSTPSPNQINQLLFDAGEPGFWHDFSDFSSLYQDANGLLAVTAVEQPFGLVLDKRYDLARGAEATTNGNFATGTWTTGPVRPTGWVTNAQTASEFVEQVAQGARVVSTTGNIMGVSQFPGAAMTIGKTYEATVDMAIVTSGAGIVACNGATLRNIAVAGTTKTIFVATASNIEVKRSGGVTDFVVRSISVKEIPGIHGTQATAANRPVVSARRNQLISDLSLAVVGVIGSGGALPTGWSVSAVAGITRAVIAKGTLPDGRAYFDYRVSGTNTSGALGFADIYMGAGVAAAIGQPWVSSARIQLLAGDPSVGFNNPLRRFFISEYNGAAFVTNTNSVQTIIATEQLFTAARTFTGAATNLARVGIDMAIAIGGTVDLTFRVTQPQLEYGLTPTRWQRVTTATDYDSVGFPVYLRFDNVNDGYVTPSVNFAPADKMTVFAGVTKLNDAVISPIVELSVDPNVNNGAFSLLAPSVVSSAAYNFRSRGTVAQQITSTTTFPAPNTAVVTGTADIPGDALGLRVNGIVQTPIALDQGTGTYGNYPMYVGSRAGATFFSAIQLNQLIVRGSTVATPLATIQQIESFVAGKTLYT